MGTRGYPWVSKYPYRDTHTDMGTSTGTIFIQRGGDGYHTTRTRGYPLTSLTGSMFKRSNKILCGPTYKKK